MPVAGPAPQSQQLSESCSRWNEAILKGCRHQHVNLSSEPPSVLSVCRRAKQQAEWEERQKVRAATQKEMAGEPFDAEVTKCEQLAAYLAKFTAQAEAHNAAAADGGAAAAPPKGYSMPKKKGEQNPGAC